MSGSLAVRRRAGRRRRWHSSGKAVVRVRASARSIQVDRLGLDPCCARTALLAAAQRHVPVFGYAATRIKKTLTGSGRAPKEQIQHSIQVELGLSRLPEPDDVADACAVALCHFHVEQNRRALGSS